MTYTDVVCPVNPNVSAATPTGPVAFTQDGTALGTRTLSPGGGTNCSLTSITTSGLRAGRHTVTAFYSGDDNYFAGPLETLIQTVNCPKDHGKEPGKDPGKDHGKDHKRGNASGGSCRKK